MIYAFLGRLGRAPEQCLRMGGSLLLGMTLGTTWAADLEHQVRPGDTLYTLSDAYLEDPLEWEVVANYNGIQHPRRLQPGSVLRIPDYLLRKKPGGADVLHVQGEAVFQPRFGAEQALAVGQRLIDGDRVRTAEHGNVTLRLADGSLLKLSPGSVLSLDRLRYNLRTQRASSALHLDRGRVESNVTPQHGRHRFLLTTPKMAAGVRGTEFGITASAAHSTADVLQGTIEVRGGTRPAVQAVSAGFGGVLDPQSQIVVKRLPAAPDLSLLPQRITQPVVELPFAPVPGAVAYRVRITMAEQTDFVLDERVHQQARQRVESLPDGYYQVEARAISAEGLEGQPAMQRFELDAYPLPAVTLTPEHEQPHTSPELNFAWLEVEHATAYQLQIAADGNFTQVLHEGRTTETRWSAADSLPAGRYFWRMRSEQEQDIGPWGSTRILEFRPQREVAPSAEQQGNTLVLRWEGDPGQRFEAALATQPDFADLSHQARLDQAQWRLNELAPGDYLFRVRAIDPDGYVRPYSASHRLRVRRFLQDGQGRAITTNSSPQIDLNRP